MILHIVSSRDQNISQVRVVSHLLEVKGRLKRDLSRGRKNHSPRSYPRGMLLQTLNNRDDEGACLAGAGPGHGDDVVALDDLGDRFALDGRWEVVALLADGSDKIFV